MSSIDTVIQNWVAISVENYYTVEITVCTSGDISDYNLGGAKNVSKEILLTLSRFHKKFPAVLELLNIILLREVYTHLSFFTTVLRKYIALKFISLSEV